MKQHPNTISEFQVSGFGCVAPAKERYLQLCFLSYSQTRGASSGSPSVSSPKGSKKLEKDLKQSLFFFNASLEKGVEVTMNFADSLYFHEF